MCESFFATLETELLDRQIFRTHAQAKSAIFEFIESWYNRRRRHQALDYLTPAQFETVNDPNLTLADAPDERSRGALGLEALRAPSASQPPAFS